ncbi:MAG: membrane protein insertase YidC, partial [Spartobacteria bacterium]
MDRTSWIAIIVSVIGLFAWQWYVSEHLAPPPAPATQAAAATPPPAPAPQPTVAATPSPAAMKALEETLKGEGAEFVFNNDTGGIEQVVLGMHMGENKDHVSLNRSRTLPIGAIGFQPGEVLGGFNMTTDPAKGAAVFNLMREGGLEITKRFQLPPPGDKNKSYIVTLDISFRNTGATHQQVPDFFVSAGGAAPIHIYDLPMYTRFDWGHGSKMSNIDVNWFSASSVPLIGIQIHGERELYQESQPEIRWAAVASQYFCTVVTPQGNTAVKSVWAKRFDAPELSGKHVFGVKGGLVLPGLSLAPGATETRSFQIYAGPKELQSLRRLGPTQDKVMNFGVFGFVSEFLLWAMNSLHALVGNYAWSIILLTLLIKTALWPVQNKATNEMRKMSLLSPKMTEMREKFKDD